MPTYQMDTKKLREDYLAELHRAKQFLAFRESQQVYIKDFKTVIREKFNLIVQEETIEAILQELARVNEAHPSFNSAHEGFGILKEEVDELWDEVKANNVDHACKEAVQVAAMAIRFICDMKEKHKL